MPTSNEQTHSLRARTPPAPVAGRVFTRLRVAGRLTRAAFAADAGVPLRTAGRVLAALVETGVLVPDGRKGNSGGYVAAATAA